MRIFSVPYNITYYFIAMVNLTLPRSPVYVIYIFNSFRFILGYISNTTKILVLVILTLRLDILSTGLDSNHKNVLIWSSSCAGVFPKEKWLELVLLAICAFLGAKACSLLIWELAGRKQKDRGRGKKKILREKSESLRQLQLAVWISCFRVLPRELQWSTDSADPTYRKYAAMYSTRCYVVFYQGVVKFSRKRLSALRFERNEVVSISPLPSGWRSGK